jgi:glycosyltransferase involved in cell wall biosynthesis
MISVGLDVSGLDPSFKSHAHRGIGRYVQELSNYFGQHPSPAVSVGHFDHAKLAQSGFCAQAIGLLPVGKTTARQQLLYPLKLNSASMREFSFLHFPAHMDAPAWTVKPYVLTVLDLIPLVLSDLYRANRPSWRFSFARWLELRAITNAALCIAISQCTARDLSGLLGVSPDRIRVTPLGVDSSFFEAFAQRGSCSGAAGIRQRLGIPEAPPLILYVGGHDERKNISVLVEIVRRVRASLPVAEEAKPHLVLAGRVNSGAEADRLAAALAKSNMERSTTIVGYVADSDLRELYAESAVFLFPSLYEGFGLPCLEAMAAGVPVVSSGTSSMPEVVGDAGMLFDPRSAEEGARCVAEVLTDPSLAVRLSQRGHERARLFTWQRTGELTREAYEYAHKLIQGRKAATGGYTQQADASSVREVLRS